MEFYLGQIMQVGFSWAPPSWAPCQGQIMSIQQNTALFSILGTTYGGNGQNTFGLPNLQSRVIVGAGQGSGLSAYNVGQMGGAEKTTLTIANMPAHSHTATFTPSGGSATTVQALTGVPATSLVGIPAADSFLANTAPAGPNQPKIYAPAGSGTAVNLGGVSGGGGGAGTVGVQPAGGSQSFGILPPYLAMWTNICMNGVFPSRQ